MILDQTAPITDVILANPDKAAKQTPTNRPVTFAQNFSRPKPHTLLRRMAFQSTSKLLLNHQPPSDNSKLRPKMEAMATLRRKTQRPNAGAYWRRRAT